MSAAMSDLEENRAAVRKADKVKKEMQNAVDQAVIDHAMNRKKRQPEA